MFTGLIRDVGTVHGIDKSPSGWKIAIKTNLNLSQVQVGASVSCSGCCLSVTKKSGDTFYVDVSQETLRVTSIDAWCVMTRVNLEPSLKLGDEMGGHIVSGHVDALAEIISITPEGDSYKVVISAPDHMMPYIAQKGSVALDGISLTVNEVEQKTFCVNIIPHTWQNTTLCDKKAGDKLNLEIDTIARYVARQLQVRM